YSPCPVESTHPDFYWYGIHGVETLYTIMGPGCETVVRVHTPETDLAVGTWKTGRIGTFRGRRKADNGYQGGYGGTAFGTKGIAQIGSFSGYEPLLVEVVKFFRTGKAPVTPAESIEIYTFMSAADLSRQKAGTPVKLADVESQAREAARKKLASYLQNP
ncbi:MAG TPA: dehydrogenase, partial [Planctomycetaceae bacterium]|nr:dehydrogenase [Planctomycetaceae bacterium]